MIVAAVRPRYEVIPNFDTCDDDFNRAQYIPECTEGK